MYNVSQTRMRSHSIIFSMKRKVKGDPRNLYLLGVRYIFLISTIRPSSVSRLSVAHRYWSASATD